MNIHVSKTALLFQGVTASSQDYFPAIERIFEQYYGPMLQKSSLFRFDEISNYYKGEMGEKLYKCFYIFEKPVSLENFYRYKIESQSLEELFKIDDHRCVNIDPGSLTLYQLSLLTTKAFSHRTYLAEGIYAECTLLAQGKNYTPLQWTYPDYKTPEALEFFANAKKYLKHIL